MSIERPKTIVEQVHHILRQRIYSRAYAPGERLPSESELAQELGVSRATVRTVLAKFATEGLILRKQGDGTYVNEQLGDVEAHYGGERDFSRLIEASGFRPHIQELAQAVRPAAAAELALFDMGSEGQVMQLERLFLADERPVIWVQNVLPMALLQVGVAVNGRLPIHKILQTACAQQIAYAISDISATLVTADLHTHLQQPVNSPILKLQDTFFNRDNMPLSLGISYYDHTVLKLRLVQAWGV